MKEIEEPYPYNLPIFRRAHSAMSPNGKHQATIEKAFERGMSNPTMGQLKINGELQFDQCSPVFLWSDDSRYLAVAQYVSLWFRSRERLIILDVQERVAYFSKPQFNYVIISSFDGGVIKIVNSPT